MTLGHHRTGDRTPALSSLPDAHHLIGQVGVAASSRAPSARHHARVERGQLAAQIRLADDVVTFSMAWVVSRFRNDAISRPARKIFSAPSFGDEVAVAAGGIGLALERTQLAAHLAEEILERSRLRLGGGEATLGSSPCGGGTRATPAASSMISTAILGPGVEHRVDLALADDRRAAGGRRRSREELLDVEEAAGHAVDGVSLSPERNSVRVTVTSLNSMGSMPGRVVDGEAHLGVE